MRSTARRPACCLKPGDDFAMTTRSRWPAARRGRTGVLFRGRFDRARGAGPAWRPRRPAAVRWGDRDSFRPSRSITVSQGYTYAGGLELFCHGHIRLAEPQASFSVACRRWGVPLVDGGTVYLPRLIGWGAALPLIITGQRIAAERAWQIGLVWELVPRGEGLARAFSIARQICQQPRNALPGRSRLGPSRNPFAVGRALALEARNLRPVMESESTRQGVESFLEGKRFWFA